MEPYDTVQEAYNDAIKELGDDAKVLIMPYGGSTLPVVNE
jgi:nickel-dependent lactate racemase